MALRGAGMGAGRLLRARATPRFAGRLAHDGLEPAPPRPRAEFAAAMREESASWARKVPQPGLSLD